MKVWFTVFISTIVATFVFMYTEAQRADVVEQQDTVNATHTNVSNI